MEVGFELLILVLYLLSATLEVWVIMLDKLFFFLDHV